MDGKVHGLQYNHRQGQPGEGAIPLQAELFTVPWDDGLQGGRMKRRVHGHGRRWKLDQLAQADRAGNFKLAVALQTPCTVNFFQLEIK